MAKKASYEPHGAVAWTGFALIIALSVWNLAWIVTDMVGEWQALQPLTVTGIAIAAASLRFAFAILRKWSNEFGGILNVAAGIIPVVGSLLSLTGAGQTGAAALRITQWSAIVALATLGLGLVAIVCDASGLTKSVWRWKDPTWTSNAANKNPGSTVATSHPGAAVTVSDALGDSGRDDSGTIESGVAEDSGEESGAGASGVGGAAGEVMQQEHASAGVGEAVEGLPLEAVTVRRQRADEQPDHDEPEDHEERGLDDVGDDQRQREDRDDVDEQQQEHSPDEEDHAGSAAGSIAPVLAEDHARADAGAPDFAGGEPAVEDGRLAGPEERQQPAK